MKITALPIPERPRERLLRLGPAALSTLELLTIVIGHGTKDCSAAELAQKVISQQESLTHICNMSLARWQQIRGLGSASYTRLQAALELRRREEQEQTTQRKHIHNYDQAAAYCQSRLGHYQQEVFGCLFLDTNQCIIAFDVLFYGTIDSASIYPREVLKRALFHNAAKLICSHNHPSGNPTPSQADIHITQVLSEALALIDIDLLDHIIVTPQACQSWEGKGNPMN